jgi:hypothetical protein
MAANHAQRSPGRALKHARFVASDETVSCKAAVAAHAALAGSGLGDLLARSSKRRRLTSNSSLRLLASTLLILDCVAAIRMVLLTCPLFLSYSAERFLFQFLPLVFGEEKYFLNRQV